MGAAGPQGRERVSREAIDSENRVIRCANTASPPALRPPSQWARTDQELASPKSASWRVSSELAQNTSWMPQRSPLARKGAAVDRGRFALCVSLNC